jgi:hypothetical protein
VPWLEVASPHGLRPQVIDSDQQGAWTATATQPGLASAYVNDVVATVEAARRWADTPVVVYLHWRTELDACPNPLQEPPAQVLLHAGADIVVGTLAHVLLGCGMWAPPTWTSDSGASPSRTTPARERERFSCHRCHGSSHRLGYLATGLVRGRNPSQPVRRGRDRSARGLAPGACVYQRVSRARSVRRRRGDREVTRPGVGKKDALRRLGTGRLPQPEQRGLSGG